MDSIEYLWQSFNLKHFFSNYCGDPNAPIHTEIYTRRTILYGFFILVIQAIAHSDLAVIFIQNILSVVTLLFLYKLTLKYSTKPRPWIFILAFIFYPTWFIYTNMVMAELLLAVFLFFAFYFLLQFFEKKRSRDFLWYTVFLTLAFLTKPVLLYFLVVHIILAISLAVKERRFKLVLFALLLPVAFTIHSYSSYKMTGYFHYSSIVNHNALHYYSETVLTDNLGRDSAKKITDSIQEEAEKIQNFEEYNDKIVIASSGIIKSNFDRFLKLEIRGWFNYFLDPGRYDMSQLFQFDNSKQVSFFDEFHSNGIRGIVTYVQKIPLIQTLSLTCIFLWNILMALGFLLFTFSGKVDRRIKFCVWLFVGYVWILTGLQGSSRFRMEVYPMLLFAVCVGVGKGREKVL